MQAETDRRTPVAWLIAARKGAMVLGLLVAVAALALLSVDYWTQDLREARRAAFERALVAQLLPPGEFDQDPLASAERLSDVPGVRQIRAIRDGRLRTTVWLGWSAPDGYSGPVELAIAFAPNGAIQVVDVLSHRETPGLGDVIERRKSEWLTQFSGIGRPPHIALRSSGGQIDGISGATITTRAVTRAVRAALLRYQADLDQ